MKIFPKEVMVRYYKIDGIPYEVDLCFIVHKLVIEIDEDGHVYYDKEKHQIRRKLTENLGFTFLRINPGVENPDLDTEIAKIYNYSKESSIRLAVNSTEKLLKEKFAKQFLSYMSSVSKSLKHTRYFIKKNTAINIRHEKHTIKNKTNKAREKIGTTCCLGCKDYTHNFKPEEVQMTNKVLRKKSDCVVC